MDGCDPGSGERRVLVVGATNRPEELDEAARRWGVGEGRRGERREMGKGRERQGAGQSCETVRLRRREARRMAWWLMRLRTVAPSTCDMGVTTTTFLLTSRSCLVCRPKHVVPA